MKLQKLLAIYIVVILTFMGANVWANIFASLVEVEFGGTFPATISYTLNEWATSVEIDIKQNDVTLQTISIGQDENGSYKGPNSVLWDGSLNNGDFASGGIYTIEILANDDIGHQTWELISFDEGPDNWFWSSAGVAANRRQTSPYFGMIYVCERSGGTSNNLNAIHTERGLYLFNSFAYYWGPQHLQSTSYATGNSVVSWFSIGGNVPVGVNIGPDDRIYLSVLGTSGNKGGVVSGDGLYSASSAKEILTLNDLSNHGPVSRSAIVGTGPERILYTCEQLNGPTDFDPQTLSQNTKSVLRRYRIGDTTGPYSGAPEQLLGDVLVRPFDLDFDSKGYLYVIQNETSEKAIANDTWGLSKWDISVVPPQEVWHVPTDSLPPNDFEPVALLPRLVGFTDKIDSPGAPAANFVGLDIDESRNRLYVARRGADQFEAGGPIYQVLQFSMETGEFTDGFDTSVNVYIVDGDTVTQDLGTASSRGYNQRDVAVDAAGNVISVNSNTEALRVYSPPDGPNSFLTYSPWAIQVGSGDPVIPTPVTLPTRVENTRDPFITFQSKLFQNYPNPFNSKTVISYQLPVDSFVELTIYSISGQKISTLVLEQQQAGNNRVEWDANQIASGIYLYKLSANGYEQTKKLVLIK